MDSHIGRHPQATSSTIQLYVFTNDQGRHQTMASTIDSGQKRHLAWSMITAPNDTESAICGNLVKILCRLRRASKWQAAPTGFSQGRARPQTDLAAMIANHDPQQPVACACSRDLQYWTGDASGRERGVAPARWMRPPLHFMRRGAAVIFGKTLSPLLMQQTKPRIGGADWCSFCQVQ